MPRRGRLAASGIAWHIIQRGNNRSACFFSQDDFQFYLDTLREQADVWQCAIHAYVLMTNHVHLLLTPSRADGPSLMMKHLGQRYVQYINRRYRRSGTLWEGRFRSCLAQSETYALTCYRYIELNPVRAGMVCAPADYRWSSYHHNATGKVDAVLTPHPNYLALATQANVRLTSYRALFATALDLATLNRIRGATNGCFALGNARFEAQIAATLSRRVTPGKSGRPKKVMGDSDRPGAVPKTVVCPR